MKVKVRLVLHAFLTALAPFFCAAAQPTWKAAPGTSAFGTATNWLNDTLPLSSETVLFTGSSQATIDVAGSTAVNGLAFDTSGGAFPAYTLGTANSSILSVGAGGVSLGTGGAATVIFNLGLALTANQTWTVGNGETLSAAGVISGAFALGKAGVGTLVLSGANTFSGGTTVTGGTLAVAADGQLGAAPASATPGALTLDGGGLEATASFTLNANRGVALGTSGGTLTADPAVTLTYNGVIAGSGALTKSGSGTLVLGGTNTYTGATTISNGYLSIASDAALGAAPPTATAGKLVINGSLATTASFTLNANRGVTLANSGSSFDIANGTTLTYGGIMAGAGGVNLNPTGGTLVLTGANTYTGATTNFGSTLQIGNGGASGSLASSNVVNNGALIFNNSFTGSDTQAVYAGAISGSGTLEKKGTGFTYLSGSVAPGGGTTISGGYLTIGAGGTTGTLSGNVSLATGGQLQFYRSDASTFNGAISGTGHVANYAGTLTLGGANTYGGNTFVSSSGTLVDAAAGSYSPNSTMRIDSGATLQVNNSETVAGLNDYAANTSGSVVLAATKTLTVNNGSGNTFSGVISGSGTLLKKGPGTLTLQGVNTFTGGTTISDGTLTLGTNAATTPATKGLLASTGVLNLSPGSGTTATFNVANAATQTIAGLNFSGAASTSASAVTLGTGTLVLGGDVAYDATNNPGAATISGGAVQLGAARTFTVGDSNTTGSELAVSSPIVDGGSAFGLTKAGGGTLLLTGANTYTGGTTVSAGKLTLGTGGSLAATGGLSLTPGSAAIASFELTGGQNQTVAALGFGGAMAALSNVSLNAGTLTLNGNVTYDATNNPGNANIAAAGGALSLNDAVRTFDIGDSSSSTVELSISAPITSPTASAGGLTKTGAGTLLLSGANTYTGATTIRGGKLQLGSGASLAGSVVVDAAGLTSTAVLDLGNATASIGGLTFGGSSNETAAGNTVTIGTGTLTLAGNVSYVAPTLGTKPLASSINGGTLSLPTGAHTFSVADIDTLNTELAVNSFVSGAGGITKTGAGTLALTNGANSFSGTLALQEGTLTVNSLSALGAAAGTLSFGNGVGAAATLRFTGNGPSATSKPIELNGTGAYTLEANGAGSTVSATFAGAVTSIGTGTRVLTLAGDNSASNTLSGAISGGVNLQKKGFGTWRLTGANTYTGTTVIESGTLRLGANGALPATTDVYLNLPSSTSQATLDFANTSQTVASLTFAGAGMGTVTLGTGTLTLNGPLSFLSGTTQPAPAAIFGGTIALPATRVMSVAATSYYFPQLTIASQLTGAGGLTKADGGALLLLGSNIYAGGTTISGGAVIAGSDTALSTGAISVASGARLAASEFAHNSTVTLANPVTLASGAGFGSSYAEGRLRLTGAVTVTATGTAATIQDAGEGPTILTGTLDAATAGSTVTLGSGRLGLYGSVGSNIATLAADGGALFFGSHSAMPAGAGSIAVLNNSYAGVVGRDAFTPDPNVLISHVTPANYNGTLGFDTDHESASHATVFTGPLDLTGFTQANFRLGTTSLAVLAGAIKPAGGTNYPFGNGHGLLVVQSNLGGNAGVTVSSGIDRELVVALRGNNTFTGNIAIERSGLLLDGPRTLPGTATVAFGAGFNYFGATEAWGRADDFVAKFTAITQTKPVQVASVTTTSNVAVLGLDSRASVEQTLKFFERDPNPRNLRTIAEPINLAGLTDATVYLGTLSNVAVNGTVTGIPDTGGNALSLLALDHGQLTINSVLASAGVHHVKIGSAALGEEGGVVRLMNNNSYAGGTQLQGGTLLVGAPNALGTGALTIDAGTSGGTPTLAAATTGNVTLANPITLTTGVHLGRTRDLDDSAAFVQARAATLTLAGPITGTGALAGRNGRTFVTGANNYSGATYSDYGALIFGSAQSLPNTTIYASRSGYLGAAFTSGSLATDFLGKFDLSTTGTVGLDTLPGAGVSTFAAVDFHAFNSIARLGSATQAVVSGAITPSTASPNTYRFGGGGGTLTVTGALTDNGTLMRGVSVDSSPDFPLTLRLAGTNTYAGSTNVANSAVIFAAGALPTIGGSLVLNSGAYIGTEDTANAAAFLARFGTPNATGVVVGLDTAPGAASVASFAGSLGLGGSLASAYVGTATSATFTSTASIFSGGQTTATVHRLAGYKGGSLRLEFPITAGSVIVGDADTPQTHGTDTLRSTVTLTGSNSYAGGTTLFAGALAFGSSTALGTGPLTVNEANFERGSNPLLYSAVSGLTLPNAIVLNAELDVGSSNHLTLGGVISGAEEIYKVGSGTLTLSGNNTFAGGVYLAEGSLNVSSATALGTGPLQLGVIASSVNFLVPATINGLFGDNSTQQISTPSSAQLTLNQTSDSRFPGRFVGTGSLLLSNSASATSVARMVLGGASTFTGGATIGSGVVAVAAGATSSAAGAVTSGPFGTGTVTLNGGKLAVDGGIVFSNPLTLTTGRLGGTGTFAPVATLAIAGSGPNRVSLSPGEATPGTLAFTNTNMGGTGIVLSLSGGGAYDWKLMDATNASGGWDMVAVTGTVDISATSANPFKFQLTSVLANGSGGLAGNFTQTAGYQWPVLTATSITNFAANKFTFDTTLFSNANLNGNFGLSINPANTVLTLTFTPVPEPSTYLLLGGGLAVVALALRRRRGRRS